MCGKKGFTLIELLVVIMILFLLGAILMPTGCFARRAQYKMKNMSQIRGVHQASVILANGNNRYLAGIDSTGHLLDSTDAAFSAISGGNTGVPGLGGGAFNTRFYLLLKGNFISGDLLINPLDHPNPGKWTNSAQLPIVPSASNPSGQFSYALSNIADGETSGTRVGTRSPGRVSEWRDNANSAAALISDRNSAGNVLSPRGIWATSAGAITDWKGNVVWGDNHAEFLTSSTGLSTRYADTTNTGDGLFTDSNGNPGEGRDNALFNYVSANY